MSVTITVDDQAPSTGKPVKVTAMLSERLMEALREIAAKRGISLTAAIGQAISHERYFLNAVENNQRVLLEDAKTGRMREVLIDPLASKRA